MLARNRWVADTWELTKETFAVCLRYRVTGLASEAGFFALLSLPPLVLGLFGGVGYVGAAVGRDNVALVQTKIVDYAEKILTTDTVRAAIVPTLDDVFKGGRADLISLGFLLSLWSGSRVLNVFVDTISIMYGQGGLRGIVRTRALSFSLYVVGLVFGIVLFPLVVLGPAIVAQMLPARAEFLLALYWPMVTLMTVAGLASLYHVATPRRSAWRRDVPGAVLALLIWVGASFVLRWVLTHSVGGDSTSIYGPLAAPIVVLIWLYFLAIAVLIGAALNAASRALWPPPSENGVTTRLARVLGRRSETLTPMPVDEAEVPSRRAEKQMTRLSGRP